MATSLAKTHFPKVDLAMVCLCSGVSAVDGIMKQESSFQSPALGHWRPPTGSGAAGGRRCHSVGNVR